MKTFVIAGTNDQAMTWVKNDITKKATITGSWRSISDYIIVHRPEQLKGFRNPTGTFVGTWRKRADLPQILQTLHINSDPPNKTIVNLLTEVMK